MMWVQSLAGRTRLEEAWVDGHACIWRYRGKSCPWLHIWCMVGFRCTWPCETCRSRRPDSLFWFWWGERPRNCHWRPNCDVARLERDLPIRPCWTGSGPGHCRKQWTERMPFPGIVAARIPRCWLSAERRKFIETRRKSRVSILGFELGESAGKCLGKECRDEANLWGRSD